MTLWSRLFRSKPSTAPSAPPPVADRPPSAASVKAEKLMPKVDDPFADLDSVEAEMLRLLGREKAAVSTPQRVNAVSANQIQPSSQFPRIAVLQCSTCGRTYDIGVTALLLIEESASAIT